MTSLTERLTGKGAGQVMEYEEEFVHNVPMAARNAVMSMAKKVEDNVLRVITALVVTPPSTMHEYPRSQSAGRPAEGTQCPCHKVGMYAFG